SAANPRFIETVPRRGYRFTFTVEPPPEAESVDEKPAPLLPVPNGSRRSRTLLLAVVAVGLAGVGSWLWIRRPGPETPGPVRRFVLRTPVASGSDVYNRPMSISPDGKHIALISGEGSGRLWIQHLDQEQPTAVEG